MAITEHGPRNLSAPQCTVCGFGPVQPFRHIRGVSYWRCGLCEATLMDPSCWPSVAEERATYDLHENQTDDPGYRHFLSKVLEPLRPRLHPGMRGLDFGCGPGPALATMLQNEGMQMSVYDPIYAPAEDCFDSRFDFITCTEVAEHLHQPAQTFARLRDMLVPGGWLAVMTCFQTDDTRFENWHYRRDPTHVVFYREATFHWLAQTHDWELVIPAKDVALLRKPRRRQGA